MTTSVLPLYPRAAPALAVDGLYLSLRLHTIGTPRSPFVYGSFVSSLDGRIATGSVGPAHADPLQGLKSHNDFRLFQELHAQADCLVTHGGYLRALAAGRLGNVLQVDASGSAPDLARWRASVGLPPQPAIVVASASLEFQVHPSIAEHGQRLIVATGARADALRARALRDAGIEVIVAGEGLRVQGAALAAALGALGYRSLYLLAGPMMLETMLRDRRLDRLFLTLRHRLLGDEHFQTMIHGPRLGAAGDLELQALYLDAGHAGDVAQWFAEFVPSSARERREAVG